jgi:predicted O-methyltransferase YrrM
LTGGGSSLPEVQRLLAVLAAGKRCAETGTAFGEGAAAIASTARSLVTVEADADRAQVAAERLRGFDNVELFVGDWREHLPPRAPYELLFFDAGRAEESQAAIDLLAPGGLFVKDDLTPVRSGPDPVRAFLLNHPQLVAVEILTTPQSAAIVASRRTPSRRRTNPPAPSSAPRSRP